MDVQAGAAKARPVEARTVREVLRRSVPSRSIADLGGFVGPSCIGGIEGITGGAAGGLIPPAVPPFVSSATMAPVRLAPGRNPAPAASGGADEAAA